MTSQKNSYPLQKMSRHEEIHGVVLNNGFIVVHDDVDVKGIIIRGRRYGYSHDLQEKVAEVLK